jgi:hypothetical protein
MLNYRRAVPRFQLSIRSTLLLVAIIALVVASVVGIGRSLTRYPYTAALHRMSEWCSSGVEAFDADVRCDWSGPKPVWVVDKPATPSMACLLKLAYVHRPRHNGINADCDITSLVVAVDGRSRRTNDIFSWASQVGISTIPGGEMVSLQKIVSKLPPSQSHIPDGHILQVGFSQKGIWVSRTYDTGRLPPEILEVIGKTWSTIGIP